MWTTVASAITDLRALIADGPTDKFASQKLVFGRKNGTNTLFKTFERRRLTDFTTAASPLGIFKNGTHVAAATESLETGDFTLSAAPANTDEVVASYYYQWFNDSELTIFLKNATQWLGLGADPTVIPDGLQPAALHYAGQESYHRLAAWWAIRISETYKVEDRPAKSVFDAQKSFMDMAQVFKTKSEDLRKQYYTRQDQNLQPLFGVVRGQVREVVPRR